MTGFEIGAEIVARYLHLVAYVAGGFGLLLLFAAFVRGMARHD